MHLNYIGHVTCMNYTSHSTARIYIVIAAIRTAEWKAIPLYHTTKGCLLPE